ncbi:MAG: TIGR02646 family protein [Verrucomicrobiales bacterium]|nr:TIGR02646 family protein [Verrucomicrobiales bacterium]
MRKFRREAAPEFLAGRWEAWGREWEERQRKGGSFHWHQVDGEMVNQRLLPGLRAQTQDHCSFCDAFPVSPPSDPTIEHFRPKSRFPREAYHWPNLHFCCRFCQQQKRERYEEDALRPDADDYEFERYFRCDFTTGMILVNERASPEDQRQARATIDLYGLNRDHPAWRKQQRYLRDRARDRPLDDFAYRDFVDG